jgi:hypothetical protein
VGNTVKWTIWVVFWAMLIGFAQYTLPQRDVVRVVSTEIIPNFETNWPIFFSRQDSGTAAQPTRALRLISTVRQQTYLFGLIRAGGDQTMIYRNEDTGWLWPPYFKFDSSDLQSEAEDLRSTAENPQWAVVTHYGWRIRYLTIYPNAITIRPVDSPDVRLIPWVNILILTILGATVWAITVRWRRFKARRIDPRLERLDDAVDERRAGLSRWLASWRK